MTKNESKTQTEKMTYNYHTHTYRCRHANGKIEEYIKRAIACGVTHMGFSDHAPYICTNGVESVFRVPVSEVGGYFSEISALKEKYKEQIDIKIGFEMEFYPRHFEKMLNDVIEYGAEYLILGPHYIEEEQPSGVHVIQKTDSVKRLEKYSNCIVDGIKSGVFTYIAHPDMINFTGDVEVFQREIRKICSAARECNIPLEINFLGIRDNRNYPNEAFWEIAGEERSPVTFGFDSHETVDAYDEISLVRAMEIVEKYNLNYIGKPNLIMLEK
ncbi:MAG: histidinol-phosphatase [Clostridia bacterium]|nr:histidinol-phosphatase [Clostridia bacterium]